MAKFDFTIGMAGAPGQGLESAGPILLRICARRGLYAFTYSAYQSLIRGGHTFLTARISTVPVENHGDKTDLILALNQDSMDKHVQHIASGGAILYNSDNTTPPDDAPEDIQLCPLSFKELSNNSRAYIMLNTLLLGAALNMTGTGLELGIEELEGILAIQFRSKGQTMVDENVNIARTGYEYAAEHFTPFSTPLPVQDKPLMVTTGSIAMAMGGAAAGVKFYCAYPMSPSTGVLLWMAANARDLGIMVRQCEDEISVANMVIGAAHTGCRAMCATSGGGFALMTEAIGSAGMMEIPVVYINVQRGGPSTGLPTKVEQGDLWQLLGASQGDFPKIIVAPTSILDSYDTIPELFNLVDKFQCPGMVLSDLTLSMAYTNIDPDRIKWEQEIDRGELITQAAQTDGQAGEKYKRFKITESGVSPRAIPGVPDHLHVVATDEHDEDGGLISDEFTNPHKRRDMMEKRQRKMEGITALMPLPDFDGPDDAEVTLIGWGATKSIIGEAAMLLTAAGIRTNHIHFKWLYPMDEAAVSEVLSKCNRAIIVEGNYTGQFARYLRSETGFKADGHIRKYDGEPFMPHHIVDGVKELGAGETDLYVPYQEIVV